MSAPATPDGEFRHNRNTITPGRISKNPKACEECRRRKQRCDGKTPCSLCIKRNSPCSYRSYIRHRPSRASQVRQDVLAAQISCEIPSEDPPAITNPVTDDSRDITSSDGLPRSMPHRLAIFNNIRATQDTSRGKTELFYGASSPFSVLQHLDAHLPMQGAAAVYPDPNEVDVQNGDKSIRSYNYQGIVFDQLSDPVTQANPFDASSYASAQIALRNFLVTACPRLPFLSSSQVCDNFEKFYGTSGSGVLNTVDRALVIAALGLGAYPITNLPHRQVFLAQARAEAVNIMYDINTKTVQATLMLAQFEFEIGNPNICYLHLGGAIRKAFAAGVHRGSGAGSRETMRALYCYESLVCFVLGKRPILTDEDLALPQPGESSFSAYLVRLCTIVRSAHRLYHLDDTVVADLNAAEAVSQQLGEYLAALRAGLGLIIGGPLYALTGDNLVWHITLSHIFNITKLLLFRPFLLLCLELRRRGVRDIRKERNGGVEMSVVYAAAARSVSAANDIVDLCEALFSMQIGIEGLYSHGFHLESACFVLALAAVHQSTSLPSGCFDKLHTGLRLLRRLGEHQPIRSVTAAVEQMIDRISASTGQIRPASGGTMNDSPSLTLGSGSGLTAHPIGGSVSMPAVDPLQDILTPVGWDHDLSLNDLWSMMDWNVGFHSIETAATPMPGL